MTINAPKGMYPPKEDIMYGGAAGHRFGQSILKIFQRSVPRLKNIKTLKEAKKVLYEEIQNELATLGLQGFNDIGSAVIDDIIKNSKVEYKNDRVCVTYRKFKKCMKLNEK